MISVNKLCKNFGSRMVLNDISLEIPEGKTTGIVGPNGSGKTTMIKSILGLVKPDFGEILIDGKVIDTDCDYRRNIGYISQIARYPENMTVKELFDFIKQVRGEKAKVEQHLVEYFGIEQELEKRMRTLSGGNKQKVGATLAMMFDPQILIFDEPTAGLDPQSSIRFKNLIRQEHQDGKTILLTTHIMSEIEELADHIVFIVEGKIRYNGPIHEFMYMQQESKLESAVAKMMEEAAA